MLQFLLTFDKNWIQIYKTINVSFVCMGAELGDSLQRKET
jgi:hypothetical protein